MLLPVSLVLCGLSTKKYCELLATYQLLEVKLAETKHQNFLLKAGLGFATLTCVMLANEMLRQKRENKTLRERQQQSISEQREGAMVSQASSSTAGQTVVMQVQGGGSLPPGVPREYQGLTPNQCMLALVAEAKVYHTLLEQQNKELTELKRQKFAEENKPRIDAFFESKEKTAMLLNQGNTLFRPQAFPLQADQKKCALVPLSDSGSSTRSGSTRSGGSSSSASSKQGTIRINPNADLPNIVSR